MDHVSTLPDAIAQILRYVLIAVGSYLAGKGVSPELWIQITGIVMAIASAVWGLYVKTGTKAVPVEVAGRRDVPTVSAVTGAEQK
ncbi:MAG: hypothetical protein E6R03_16660 [Hyphomicrobiaceae bacterium]|nr:MAG: hypothetical protein E6R03_16660 [Hyphomicrobiaceae bacterium]